MGRPRRKVFLRGGTVKQYETRQIDNRDSNEMYGYMEARIEALKRRIRELEEENDALRWVQRAERQADHSRPQAAIA
jgi:hypothetical protein